MSNDGVIDLDHIYFYATTQLQMDDDVFWDSSLAFLFGQFDRLKEMNDRANKTIPKRRNKMERTERVEKQSFKRLSPQEIAELRAKANK